jgi:carotenoid 1,2-hydratase
MTERGRQAVTRTADAIAIGPSMLVWNDGELQIDLNEVGAPIPRRVRGIIRLRPTGFPGRCFQLDAEGHHFWHPIAPRARIEVGLDRPSAHWSGSAYFDSNFGSQPLEAGFQSWTWSRADQDRRSVVFYDAQRRDDATTSLALRFGDDATVEALDPAPATSLPRTAWRLPRMTRLEPRETVTAIKTLLDAPFYARSLVSTVSRGRETTAFHETLSLQRLRSQIVRAMLMVRMPRAR